LCLLPSPSPGLERFREELKIRFELTQGLDPIFRPNDGSNCSHGIDTSTVDGRSKAYSLLISKGLIRIELPVPDNAEFSVVGVVNPCGCNDPAVLSMYRRPLPATNLWFLSAVMWDGRESSPQTDTQKITFATNPADLLGDLKHQAMDAVRGHAQGAMALSPKQQQAIAEFEMALATAQAIDYRAGALDAGRAAGGRLSWPGRQSRLSSSASTIRLAEISWERHLRL
jgi:cytochrome c peroxidase